MKVSFTYQELLVLEAVARFYLEGHLDEATELLLEEGLAECVSANSRKGMLRNVEFDYTFIGAISPHLSLTLGVYPPRFNLPAVCSQSGEALDRQINSNEFSKLGESLEEKIRLNYMPGGFATPNAHCPKYQ